MTTALYNATCKLIEPVSKTTNLQKSHSERKHNPQRCSFRQMSMTQQASVMGSISPNTFTVRLQTKLPVKTGWRLLVTLDGDEEEKQYEVTMVRNGFCMNLQVAGVD